MINIMLITHIAFTTYGVDNHMNDIIKFKACIFATVNIS